MGLQAMQLLSGTAISAAGGTAVSYGPDGQTINNGLHLIDTGASSFITQANITVRYKPPVLLSDGTYSKDKKTILLVEPMVTTAGKTVFNLVEIRREVHPELSASSALDLLKKGAQLCFDADVTNFWSSGNLS